MPAQYMFKDIPAEIGEGVDPVAVTLHNMDTYGVAQGMVNVGRRPSARTPARRAATYPDRFLALRRRRPPRGHGRGAQDQVVPRRVGHRRGHELPRRECMTAINAARLLPHLRDVRGARICRSSSPPGVPGPRVPLDPQKVEHLDEVCWFFPELKIVIRHGCEPWDGPRGEADAQVAEPLLLDLGVRPEALPGRRSSTTPTRAAPTRSSTPATFPQGSPTSASCRELPDVPFNDEVWPKFLHDNASRVLGLDT